MPYDASTEQKQDTSKIVERVKRFLGREIVARERWERKAYVNVMYKEGHHWVNDEGIKDQKDPNLIRRPVNKFKSVLRGLKNGIVFNDPIVEPQPDNGENVDQRELDLATAIIRNEFSMAGEDGEGMKDLLRTVIDEAALKSFACISVMPNNDENSARINDIRVHDSFDVWFDNFTLSKAQIGVISSFEDRDWLIDMGYTNVPKTNTNGVSSHSALKNAFERQHDKADSSGDGNKILVDNVYYIQHPERDEKGEKKDKNAKSKVMMCVLSGDTVLMAPTELTGYRHLGQLFFIYMMEKSKFVKYPTPWMSDIIPLQRSLNDSSENIDTILHWVAKVRFLQRAGASNTVQLIGDRHVQKVRFEGERPTFMEMPQIPQDLFRQTQMRESQIEDMVGVHASSMGRSTGDRVSGRKEAVLAAADSDNVAEPVHILETVLSMMFAQILENAADNMTKTQKITGQSGETFQALGEEAYRRLRSEEKKKNTVPVKPFKNIKVTIIPGSNALVAQGRQEVLQLIQYFLSAGMTEQSEALFEVLMRVYPVGAARDIMKMVEQKKQQAEAENADLAIAKAEIDRMAKGMPVTATPEQPHDLHVKIKMMALQTLLENGAAQKADDDPIFQAFMQNIQQHQSMLQGGQPAGLETMITGVK